MEASKSAPMENPYLTFAASGNAHIFSDASLMVAPDVAWGTEPAPMMAAPRDFRMKEEMQRIWAGTKRGRKVTRTDQTMEKSDIAPPQYAKLTIEAFEEPSTQKFNKSTGSKPYGSAISKPDRNTVFKPTDSNARKLEKDTVIKSTPRSQLEIDYSTFSYPRLGQLISNKVDTVKLLRSILVFVMFITFHADLDKIKTDTDSVFPWKTTIFTKTKVDPLKFFAWDVFGITRDLSTLVRHLEQKIRSTRWFHARRQHKDLLTQLVLRPAEDLMIQTDYALEILGTFRQDRRFGTKHDRQLIPSHANLITNRR